MKTAVLTSLALCASTAAMAMQTIPCWKTTNVYTVVIDIMPPAWTPVTPHIPVVITYVTTNTICGNALSFTMPPIGLGLSFTNRCPVGITNHIILNSSNSFSISGQQWVDPFATNQPSPYFQSGKVLALKSSTNLFDWKTEYIGTNWISYGSCTIVWYSNSVPVGTNIGLASGQWHIDRLPATDNQCRKFFKVEEQ